MSLILFFKSHVGAYLRGGKMVNVAGYQGKTARGAPAAGQRSLFDEPQHAEPTRQLVAEHEHLVDVLRSPPHADDKVEAGKQAEELKELKQEAGERPHVTESPEFKAWFGDSKVVDASGKPIVVYHGTSGDFDKFDIGFGNTEDYKKLFGSSFFSESAIIAGGYTGESGNVLPVYLRISNPLVVDAKGRTWNKIPFDGESVSTDFLVFKAKRLGHDGLIIRNVIDNRNSQKVTSNTYSAFSADQIKSATGNNGNFDAKHPDITKSMAVVFLSRPR